MTTELKKASIKLAGVALAANGTIAWRFVTGVKPYKTTFQCHRLAWERTLQKLIGRALTLEIIDSRGVKTEVKQVYILHELPSDSEHRVSFVVSDKRWLWEYTLVARDYNIPRKTGDRTALEPRVPIETAQYVDKYDYLPYSLKQGQVRWSATEALVDVLRVLHGEDDDETDEKNKNGKKLPKNPKKSAQWEIESFPLRDKASKDVGQFTIQGVTLRDQGDIALGRLLSYIPGAEVYVDKNGKTVVFDGTDLRRSETQLKKLPPLMRTGDFPRKIDRKAIRPKQVVIHYVREVELVLEFSDDYGATQAEDRDAPYIDNVIPTVDPETTISEFDPETNATVTKTVPPGTWVRVKEWLTAMDADRPTGSLPWTFETIRRHWVKGDLDGVLGGRGLDDDQTANVSMRIQALKQHFRQTFRINRRYMERIRELLAVRVALLDPVTGARAPAAVWGQACVIPTEKGKRMAARKDPENAKVFRNVDYLAPSEVGDTKLIETAPGPTRVNIIDRDIGVFRLEWIESPYGTVSSFVPCHLVGEGAEGIPLAPTRNLALQDSQPTGVGMKVESGTNGLFLRTTLDYKVLLTIIPAAPNNATQFHREVVTGKELAELFKNQDLRIQDGAGPVLEVFVAPGEATARWAWDNDTLARETVQNLLGLKQDDPDKAGLKGVDLPGYTLINEDRHLTDHSRSYATELIAAFADSLQGNVATVIPPGKDSLDLVGNMASVTIRASAAPSAKVDALFQFPGQQKPVSRFALMSDTTRQILLGTIPFKQE